MYSYRILIFILLLLAIHTGNCQWSLKRCIDSALNRNLTIAHQTAISNQTELTLQQSRWNRLPFISGSTTQNLDLGSAPSSNNNTGNKNNWFANSFALNASLIVYNGGQLRNFILQNEKASQSAHLDLDQTKNDIILSVINGFVQLIFAKENTVNTQQQLIATEALLDQVSLFVQAGKKAQSDLIQLQAQLAQDRYNYGVAQGIERTASLNLQQLLEHPYDSHFDIIVPEVKVPSEPSLENSSFYYEQALKTQPFIQSGVAAIESAKYGWRAIHGQLYPKVTFGMQAVTNYSSNHTQIIQQSEKTLQTIGYLKNNSSEEVVGYVTQDQYGFSSQPFFSQLNSNQYQIISLSVSIPIFSNHQVRTDLKKQALNIQLAQLADRQNRNLLRKEVEGAYVEVQNAQLKYLAATQSLIAEQRAWSDLQIKYDAGKSTATELIIEKSRLNQQQSQLLQAKYDLVLKGKTLAYYEGKSLDF